MRYIQNKLLLGSWVFLNIGFQGNYLSGTEVIAVADAYDDIPAATIYSPVIHKNINLELHKQLIEKILKKCEKYKKADSLIADLVINPNWVNTNQLITDWSMNPNLLMTQDTTSGITYTFFKGIIPRKDLLLDEIDILKVLECNDSRDYLAQAMQNPENLSRKKLQKCTEALETFILKVIQYVAFLKSEFDGNSQQNIKTLHEQLQTLHDEYFGGGRRIHVQDFSPFFKKLIHLQLNLPGNPPFNSLQDLFQPGMFLFYAMENGIVINGFNFAAFKRQNPLNISLDRDMSLTLETLLARFSSTMERADKQVVASSINLSQNPTRFPSGQFPQYIATPNFIKIAFQEKKS
ncbi:MAG: hypothetical protein LBH08_03005 [Puniceicoccales bacterium]|jgi:hypothetical protein|nr:hypothetical protein [Puniceicoccales bacterium]